MTRDEFKTEVERVLGPGFRYAKTQLRAGKDGIEIQFFGYWSVMHVDTGGTRRAWYGHGEILADAVTDYRVQMTLTIDRLTAARDAATPKGER